MSERLGLRLTTLLLLTCSFAVIGAVFLAQANLDATLTHWGQAQQASVYLKTDIQTNEREQIENYLRTQPEIAQTVLVSPEQALADFQRQMNSESHEILADPEILSVLPASFQFSLVQNLDPSKHLAAFSRLAQALKNLPGVDQVSYGQDWLARFSQVLGVVRSLSLFFMVITAISALFVVANCVRSAISQRRAEIQVLELVGATSRFIRKPFLREGVLLCLGAAGLALASLYLIFSWTQHLMVTEIGFLQLSAGLRFFTALEMGMALVTAGILGWITTALCLRYENSGWAAAARQGKS